MKLTLHHTETPVHHTAAAFIRGGSAKEWLAEISRYQVSLQSLECYVLPASIRSVDAAGLLVVFKDTKGLETNLLTDAYGVLAGKLYLPVHGQLYPQVTEAELQNLLLWPVQVFHPTIGFVGFEEKDKLNLTALFSYKLPQKTTWRHAHPGLPLKPPLQQIQVQQPTPEQVIESVKGEIGNKPLEEIPGAKESKTNIAEKLLDSIKYGFFKGLVALGNAIGSASAGNNSGGGTMPNMGNFKSGLFDRFISWVIQNMDAIEKKRQDEIQRLLSLFDKDNDEALRYAIPLDSPYLDRGTAPPSATLGRRSINFNLGNLGGGGRVDGWDIGDHYQTLRNKYLAAAQAALMRGDYRKAAYVHAHLLGDYHAAANVLMQGKFYREAAALYKDHLKNIPAAAECLENGGLLMEATELYIELDRLEKAGDLYHQMEQPQQANTCYEKVVGKLLGSNDHLEASRLIQDKLEQPERAKQTLLAGWESTNKAEACLKKYYDLVAQTDQENLVHHLENVYAKQTVPDTRFLNVLVHVKEKHDNAGVAQASQKMAYEIVSQQAAIGDTSGLHQLKIFVPDDRLIASDASRFVQSRPKPKQQKIGTSLQLDSSIKWLSATWHRNQLIAIGVKNGQARLARANWYENVEYYSWAEQIGNEEQFEFISNNFYNNKILLWNSGTTALTTKALPKNKYFNDPVLVGFPSWLPSHNKKIVEQGEGFSVLGATATNATIQQYGQDGNLLSSVFCRPSQHGLINFRITSRLDFWGGYYFADCGRRMAFIKSDGTYFYLDTEGSIKIFAVSKSSVKSWIVIHTATRCHLVSVQLDNVKECNIFSINPDTTAIRFITADRFIALANNTAVIYDIVNDSLVLQREIECNSPIIESIPVPHQNQFGLIEQSGMVSIHKC